MNTLSVKSANKVGRKSPANLHKIIMTMVANEDWDGIGQMLQKEEKEQESRMDKIFENFISDDELSLPMELLKKKDNEGAKALLLTLITLGGKEFVMQEFVFEMGGSSSFKTLLHAACSLNASIDIVSKLVEVGGKELVMEKDISGKNSLHYACKKNASIDIVSKLIKVGGKEIVMEKNDGWNALHYACKCNASLDVVSKLIEVGGKELVMEKNRNNGWNSLQHACIYNASIDIVSKLVELGGKELVLEKNKHSNSLFVALETNVSLDLVSKLVSLGGKALVMAKNKKIGQNSLHCACSRNVSIDVISTLIKVGGKALVAKKDGHGRNSLHWACKGTVIRAYDNAEDTLLDGALLNILTRHGGAQLLTQIDKSGKTALQLFISFDDKQHSGMDQEVKERLWKQLSDNAVIMICKGIELQVEGEYGIGGLFSSTSIQEVQDQIYENWGRIVLPALEQVMALPRGRHLPILQALIINKAPSEIFKNTVNKLAASVNTADSFERYPIDVAVRHGLAWDDGMKEVVERSDASLLKREDVSTGLLPFMLENNIHIVFHMIKASPKLVKRFDDNCGEEQSARKRRRCV